MIRVLLLLSSILLLVAPPSAISDTPVVIPSALDGIRSSAEQGNASAQASLGWFYYHGTGVDRDYKKAMEWFLKSAEQDYAEGMVNVAMLYSEGKGVIQDFAAAAKWYTRAAGLGDFSAQLALGAIYEYGEGLPQDYVRAHMWYNLAASQQGDPVAIKLRSEISAIMSRSQIAEAQKLAREWMSTQQAAGERETGQLMDPGNSPGVDTFRQHKKQERTPQDVAHEISSAVEDAVTIREASGMTGLRLRSKDCYEQSTYNPFYCIYFDIASKSIDTVAYIAGFPPDKYFDSEQFVERALPILNAMDMSEEEMQKYISILVESIHALVAKRLMESTVE